MLDESSRGYFCDGFHLVKVACCFLSEGTEFGCPIDNNA